MVLVSPPIVSVVMAVYDGQDFLETAIDSILHQTFEHFEFIVVDDGSDDATPAILDAVDDVRVRRLRNSENVGLTRSLIRGLREARGRYVARMDADDWSHPQRLARQVAFLDAYPKVVLVGTNHEIIDSEGRWLGRAARLPETDKAIRQLLSRFNCFAHGSAMLRRVKLQEVGGYRQGFLDAQDYDLWLRMAERGEVANLSDFLYRLRAHPDTKSVRYVERQRAFHELARELARIRAAGEDDDARYRERVAAIMDEHEGPAPRRVQRRALGTHLLRLGVRYLQQGYLWPGLRHTLRGVILNPINHELWSEISRRIGFKRTNTSGFDFEATRH